MSWWFAFLLTDYQAGTTASFAGRLLFRLARAHCGGERETSPGLHFNRGFQRFAWHLSLIHI